jgi:xanthine dehydrogenase molybdenum-binding subunit
VTGLNLVTHLVTEALDMDTEEFILKNVPEYAPGSNGVYSLTECIREAKEGIGWDEKKHPAGENMLPNGKYHGIGFRWMETFGGGTYGEASGSDSGALVGQSCGITDAGSGQFRLNMRLADVGVAPHSAYAMIAAEEMGANIDDVFFPPNQSIDDQGFAPHEGGTAHGLGNTGPGVAMAGRAMKEVLIKKGAYSLGVTPEECDTKNSTVYVKSDPETSIPFAYLGGCPSVACGEQFVPFIDPPNNWAMIATEVEVDPDTGKVDLIKSVIVNDVGKMIRPKTVEGQMYGAHIFDIDCGFWSECIYDPPTGVRLNPNYLEYRFATILDIPETDARPLEIGSGPGIYGSIGIGEDNHDRIIFSDAVYNAIGKWISTPITPAKILQALGKI